MVIALIILAIALIAVCVVAYKLKKKLENNVPDVKSAAETFDLLKQHGKISEQEANLAKLTLREVKRRARRAGRPG